jgi:hypothetical protein
MIEVGSCNELPNTWPSLSRDDRGAFAWLRTLLRVTGKRLAAVSLWMAGFCPIYVVVEAALRDLHQTEAPVSYVPLIGIGISFIYLPFYLTNSLERRLLMTTGLLIVFGLVAGLVGVWISA